MLCIGVAIIVLIVLQQCRDVKLNPGRTSTTQKTNTKKADV